MNVASDIQTLLVTVRNHRPFNNLLMSSCSQEISSEVQNANNFLITFRNIEGKNIFKVTIQW